MIKIRHLKKGDVLLKEGEASDCMYWLQSGSLRLFKKKGAGFIELGVVHAGEVVGELSFMDKEPRSASVEAMQHSDVIEIPRGKFDEFMANQQPWLKSLVFTLVKRLRGTNNRLREVDSNSTVYVQDEEGNTSKQHEFLSVRDTMKLTAALVLVACRNGEKQPDGSIKVRAGWLQVVSGHILSVPLSKIQSYTDVLQEAAFIRIDKQKDHVDIYIAEMDLLERYMYWLNEENAKADDKRLTFTAKGIAILDAINEFAPLEAPAGNGSARVNMEEVFTKAQTPENKMPFDWNAFAELVKSGFATELKAAGEKEKFTDLAVAPFLRNYPMLVLRHRFEVLNSKKRGEEN